MRRIFAPWDRLREVRALLPRILASEEEALPESAIPWAVLSAQQTSTGMLVVKLGAPRGDPVVVAKLPRTPAARRAQERESAVLEGLRADGRLGAWRDRLPRPLAEGVIEGQAYRIDVALKGRPPHEWVRRSATGHRARDLAAEVIEVLHRATAEDVLVDDRVLERWVEVPTETLMRLSRGSARSRLERMAGQLRDAISGRTLSAGWIHGDYWLGNLLMDRRAFTLEGIVDWDGAAPAELPLHDIFHLLVFTRRLVSGAQVGDMVGWHLEGAGWTPEERRLVERLGHGALDERAALLLYWLRHTALHAEQQGAPGPRYRLWERRNVHRVLTAL